jgi:xylulokinase
VGLVDAEAVRRGWVTLVPRAVPRPAATRVYDVLFETYKALYPALKATMHDLNDQVEASREPQGREPESTHSRSLQ